MGVYHVYQFAWSSEVGEKLFAKQDYLQKVMAYDKFSVGIYRKIKDGAIEIEQLVGKPPVEISSLIFHFLNTNKNSKDTAQVTSERTQVVIWNEPRWNSNSYSE